MSSAIRKILRFRWPIAYPVGGAASLASSAGGDDEVERRRPRRRRFVDYSDSVSRGGSERPPSNWLNHLASGAAVLGAAVLLHTNFLKPALISEMREEATRIVVERLATYKETSTIQLTDLRRQLDKIEQRMERLNDEVASSLRSVSMQMTQLSEQMKERNK